MQAGQGQDDAERGPPADLALHLDAATVRRDDRVADCKAEPGALADLARGEERVEDAVADLVRDPDAGVDDLRDRMPGGACGFAA